MIILDCEQGSAEWALARCGIPTASRYDDILTPKTLKLSQGAEKYRNQLLAEYVFGGPIDFGGKSDFMERGTALEPEARAMYELRTDADVRTVGFVYRDDARETGCSPDVLVGDDGGLEVKCPALHTHIGYLLAPDALAKEYRSQVQGNMYVTGRAWWDLYAWHPNLPPVLCRIERDEAYQDALHAALTTFCDHLREAKEQLAEHRMTRVTMAA